MEKGVKKKKKKVRLSSSCTQPATGTDEFASQIESDITNILKEPASIGTRSKRVSEWKTSWLSDEAKGTKQEEDSSGVSNQLVKSQPEFNTELHVSEQTSW